MRETGNVPLSTDGGAPEFAGVDSTSPKLGGPQLGADSREVQSTFGENKL